MFQCFRGLKCSQGKEEAIIDLETHTALHAHNNSGKRRNGERMVIRNIGLIMKTSTRAHN